MKNCAIMEQTEMGGNNAFSSDKRHRSRQYGHQTVLWCATGMTDVKTLKHRIVVISGRKRPVIFTYMTLELAKRVVPVNCRLACSIWEPCSRWDCHGESSGCASSPTSRDNIVTICHGGHDVDALSSVVVIRTFRFYDCHCQYEYPGYFRSFAVPSCPGKLMVKADLFPCIWRYR